MTPTHPQRSAPALLARRYGPLAVATALIVGAVALFGGDGTDNGRGQPAGGDTEATSHDELVLAGPMTPQRAELEGVEVDFGSKCDPDTGRIRLISVQAPPCVEPFEGDNGGATSPGVTEDEILVVLYRSDPSLDPLTAATISGAGADVDPATYVETVDGYVDLYNELYETYGRTVRVEVFTGTGAGDDTVAARADAIAIAEKDPFIVLGGPIQASSVFSSELAARGIICGPGCTLAVVEEIVKENAPYIWSAGPTPDQAAALASEMVAKLAGPGKATMAGDPALREQDRVYALVHYDTPDGDHQKVFEALRASLADNGIELATDVEFTLDLARSQENARTNISKLQAAGVTTIIYYGDPITPGALTTEATAQGFHPEWILGPSVMADTTIFARLTDHDQWKNGFGLALSAARGEPETVTAFKIYEWAHGEPPPNNTASVSEAYIRTLFNGVHLAGPDLTPESFRDGLFRFPPSGGGPTTPLTSRGHHAIWPDVDWGGSDDAAIIWFDPEATGTDEVGNEGVGMYRYALEGKRYTLGNLPDSPEEAGLFDVDSSITIFEEVPAEDLTPEYDAPG